jgi:PhnB protein
LINGHRVYVCEELDASEGGICKSPRTLGASPVRFMLEVNDAEAFVAKARAAGTTVLTPVHASSWGSRYARLRDPFGHEWGINQQLR